jgi:hypothetical protein
MGDTNRVRVRAWGAVPTVPTFYVEVPITSSSDFGFTPETTVSNIIRSDRQVSDLILVGHEVAGSISSELMYENFHNYAQRMALMPNYTNTARARVTEASVKNPLSHMTKSTTNVPNDTLTLDTPWLVQSEIYPGAILGFEYNTSPGGTLPAEHNYYRVVDVSNMASTDTVVFDREIVEPDGQNTEIKHGGWRENGSTFHPWTFEKAYLDTNQFELLEECYVNEMTITAAATGLAEIEYSMLGMGYSLPVSAKTGIPLGASLGTPLVGATGIIGPYFNGEQIGIASEISLTVNNNLRSRKAVGHAGPVSIGSGECTVTGSMTMFLNDPSLLDYVTSNDTFGLTFGLTDQYNAYVYKMDACKITGGTPDVSGKNADVMVTLEWQAIVDPATGYTIDLGTFSD